MQIKLMSDLHLEFLKGAPIPTKYLEGSDADVLVLAGDIHVGPTNVKAALEVFAKYYEHVVYVPGNHEFYGYDINALEGMQLPSNVHMLNPGAVTIQGIRFIGAPLWTNFREDFFAEHAAKRMISDFKVIKGFSPADAKKLFYEHLDFIKTQYELFGGKKVIISHFLPTVECIHPRFRGEGLLNNYFANDLTEFISDMDETHYWMFGHTHEKVNLMLGNTNLLCNPIGYPSESNTYEELCIKL